ncbi:MAG: hypothetical protein ABIG63_12020 [Chloroflexota bacterium]
MQQSTAKTTPGNPHDRPSSSPTPSKTATSPTNLSATWKPRVSKPGLIAKTQISQDEILQDDINGILLKAYDTFLDTVDLRKMI